MITVHLEGDINVFTKWISIQKLQRHFNQFKPTSQTHTSVREKAENHHS